jgi:hypothetical protein
MSLLLEGAWELGGEGEDISQQELEELDPLLLVSTLCIGSTYVILQACPVFFYANGMRRERTAGRGG